MIEFRHVSKVYITKTKKEILALDNVSFKIEKGEFVVLAGPSGAGKTTILKLIIGEEMPSSGEVIVDGKNIKGAKKKELRELRRKIGCVFQDYRLLQQKNVFENLSFVMEVTNFSEAEIKRDVPKALELVGLEEKIENFPNELSAGEKQRLAIARAIIHRPKAILADEPTGNLDSENTFEILEILKKINKLGTTVVLATHDPEVIEFLNTRVIFLKKGKIVKDGRTKVFI